MIAFKPRTLAVMLSAFVMLSACGDDPAKLVASARDYQAKGDFNAATIQLKNVLQKNPDNAEARFLFGQILQASGDDVGAERELRKAFDAGYPTEPLALPLSRALITANKAAEAVKLVGGMRAETPAARAAVATGVADAQIAAGDRTAAQAAVGRAFAAVPDFLPARITEVRLKALDRDLDGALAGIDAVLAREPKSYEALMLRAEIHVARKERGQAVADYEAAAKVNSRILMPRLRATQLLLGDGKQEEAKAQLAEAAKIAPKHPLVIFSKGLIALTEGKNELARDSAQEVLRAAADYLPARMLAGIAHLRLKEPLQAQEQFEKVVAKTRAPGPRRLLARAYLAGQEPARALETLGPLLGGDSADRDALMLAGEAALAGGDETASSRYYEQVTRLAPNDVTARARLGVARLMGGDSEQAINDLTAAAALDEHATPVDAAVIAILMRKGQLDRAKQVAEALVAKRPNEPLPYNLLGAVRQVMKDQAGARQAFEKALEIDPNYVAVAVNLGNLDVLQGKPDAAIARMTQLVERSPKQPQAYLTIASWTAASKQSPAAVRAVLDKGIAANPTDVSLRTALIGLLLREKDQKGALAAARDLIARAPGDPQALATAAQAQAAAGDTQEAANTVKKLVALRPSAPEPLLMQAELLQRAGANAEAEEALRKAAKLDSAGNTPAQQRLATFLMGQGKTAEALDIAKSIQSRQPKLVTGYLLAGDANAKLKDWPAAVAAYSKALSMQPEGTTASHLHASLVASGKTAEAEALSKKWLAEHPKDLAMRAYQAESALRRADYAQAVRIYKTMLEIQPKNPATLNNLAWAAAQTKDPQARAYAEQALAIAPESPAVLDTLAMILIEGGDTAGGVGHLKKAVSLAPGRTDLRMNLARALIKSGDKTAAKSELDAVLAQSTADPAVRRDAESLRKTL